MLVAEIPSKKAKKDEENEKHIEKSSVKTERIPVKAVGPSLILEESRPGKVYGVEAGKKVAQLLSVKPTPDTKELAAIVRYEDGVYEIVPTAVVAHHAHEVLLWAL
ncbi:hypothetical protein AAVH_24138 [Aphelenchoides avenae]|nr:hypothetical protein AAVH_24138 [Aphelenchus avenae]